MPLLKWTEDKLMTMLNQSLPAGSAKRIDYDVLPNLFMMAYDGFVTNRRVNDLRDIEGCRRRCATYCSVLSNSRLQGDHQRDHVDRSREFVTIRIMSSWSNAAVSQREIAARHVRRGLRGGSSRSPDILMEPKLLERANLPIARGD